MTRIVEVPVAEMLQFTLTALVVAVVNEATHKSPNTAPERAISVEVAAPFGVEVARDGGFQVAIAH
ncbi:MAG: hypothetical protein ACLGJB_17820 [Blastocatellia bacterium]